MFIPAITRIERVVESTKADLEIYKNQDSKIKSEDFLDEDNLIQRLESLRAQQNVTNNMIMSIKKQVTTLQGQVLLGETVNPYINLYLNQLIELQQILVFF